MVLNCGQHFYYLFRCNLCSNQRLEPLNKVCILNLSLQNHPSEKLLTVLLYGTKDFYCNMNKEILKAAIDFLKDFNILMAYFLDHSQKWLSKWYLRFIYISVFYFRYMYKTYFKRHVIFSKFYVLLSVHL